jgi:hypothetical protein
VEIFSWQERVWAVDVDVRGAALFSLLDGSNFVLVVTKRRNEYDL